MGFWIFFGAGALMMFASVFLREQPEEARPVVIAPTISKTDMEKLGKDVESIQTSVLDVSKNLGDSIASLKAQIYDQNLEIKKMRTDFDFMNARQTGLDRRISGKVREVNLRFSGAMPVYAVPKPTPPPTLKDQDHEATVKKDSLLKRAGVKK